MSTCTKPDQNIDFAINICIHVFILFTILNLFFMFYVSDLSTKTFNKEIEGAINNGIKLHYNSLNDTNKSTLHQLFDTVNIDSVVANYDTPAEVVTVNNNILFKAAIFANIALFVFIFGLVYIIKKSCNQCVSLTHILIENIIIFFFIGIVEFSFFKFVATKYAPILPSTVSTTTIEYVKSAFD